MDIFKVNLIVFVIIIFFGILEVGCDSVFFKIVLVVVMLFSMEKLCGEEVQWILRLIFFVKNDFWVVSGGNGVMDWVKFFRMLFGVELVIIREIGNCKVYLKNRKY